MCVCVIICIYIYSTHVQTRWQTYCSIRNTLGIPAPVGKFHAARQAAVIDHQFSMDHETMNKPTMIPQFFTSYPLVI